MVSYLNSQSLRNLVQREAQIDLETQDAENEVAENDNRRINGSSDNNNDTLARFDEDKTRVFGVISNLFPTARERDLDMRTFYFQVHEQVKECFGVTLDYDLWYPFVWDAVSYHVEHEARADLGNQNATNEVADDYIKFKGFCNDIRHRDIPLPQTRISGASIRTSGGSEEANQNAESEVVSEESQPFDGNIPLSQIQTSGGSQSFSDKFNISSRRPNDNMPSSFDIINIAMSHNSNSPTQDQGQSRSVPLAQQSVNRTYSSADLDTPRDNIDDISSTLTHTLDQDIDNVDNSSEFSLSIHTSAPHSNVGVKQNQGQLFVGNSSDVNESQSIDIHAKNLNKHVANDCESTSDSPTQQPNRTAHGSEDNIDIDKIATRGRESDKCGSEKRRQKERTSGKKTDRKERRNSTRIRDRKRKNDIVLTDEEEDSIALRTKRKRRRKQTETNTNEQQSDDDDDENTSCEY